MRAPLLLGLLLLLTCGIGTSSVQSSLFSHERLRIKNTFKLPEEVVSYYCARDASGFVWSGLLESERKAFTTWPDAPAHDSFYLAKNYKIHPSSVTSQATRAEVKVDYEVTAIADANGTKVPVENPKLSRVFLLKKVEGTWKIATPSNNDISPVVMESKFSTN